MQKLRPCKHKIGYARSCPLNAVKIGFCSALLLKRTSTKWVSAQVMLQEFWLRRGECFAIPTPEPQSFGQSTRSQTRMRCPKDLETKLVPFRHITQHPKEQGQLNPTFSSPRTLRQIASRMARPCTKHAKWC